jgi:hypothetical protein
VIRPGLVGERLDHISPVAAARIATPTSLRQASLRTQSRRRIAGTSLLAQLIVCEFAYVLIDGATLSIRRVEYDTERENKALGWSGLPRADWSQTPFWPPRRRCHSLHTNYMVNGMLIKSARGISRQINSEQLFAGFLERVDHAPPLE